MSARASPTPGSSIRSRARSRSFVKPRAAGHFANQGKLGPPDLAAHARAVGLDVAAFGQCLDSGRHAGKIRRDLADGKAAGITGTPAFFLGRTVPGSPTVRTLQVLKGAKGYSDFKQAIDALPAEKPTLQ
jgi:protein-disulfide isomerase